jgi:hypothetical protein
MGGGPALNYAAEAFGAFGELSAAAPAAGR